MDIKEFADFFKKQGYNVISTKSCYWYDISPHFYISLPFHRTVNPSKEEYSSLFIKGLATAIRFPSNDASNYNEGGQYVCSDKDYNLYSLHKKSRNQTRRGLENCEVRQLDFNYLKTIGHEINRDTFVRQGRDPETIKQKEWNIYCDTADYYGDIEAWGSFVEDRLVAFLIAVKIEKYFLVLHESSRTDDLEYYPNNALIYTITKSKLATEDIDKVSYGLKGIEDNPGLVRFKTRLGFSIETFNEKVIFNPVVQLLLNLGGYKIVDWLAEKKPESDIWRKASVLVSSREGRNNA